MDGRTPAYYRARLGAFRALISEGGQGHAASGKNSPFELLKQGFVHPSLKERLEGRTESIKKLGAQAPGAPLTFTELCSFNTWFAMHPEKVAGAEMVTTSINFPVTIKGGKGDIENTIAQGLHGGKQQRIRIAKAKAAAKLKLLELIKIG